MLRKFVSEENLQSYMLLSNEKELSVELNAEGIIPRIVQ